MFNEETNATVYNVICKKKYPITIVTCKMTPSYKLRLFLQKKEIKMTIDTLNLLSVFLIFTSWFSFIKIETTLKTQN